MRTITSPSDAVSPKCAGASLHAAQASAVRTSVTDW
jgi:hypothetical protein